MQTKEPRKRSKTTLVIILIIIIPLLIFFLILINTAPEQTGETFHYKATVGNKLPDTIHIPTITDTTNK